VIPFARRVRENEATIERLRKSRKSRFLVLVTAASLCIVDNRRGAGGRLALGSLKGGPVDGTAMILTPASTVTVFPHVYKTLGYDAFKDFAPVTTVCSFPFLITVGPMVPADVRTLADFVKWCRANPKQATYGTAAAGRCCTSLASPWLRPAVSHSCICHMAVRVPLLARSVTRSVSVFPNSQAGASLQSLRDTAAFAIASLRNQ
jgi:hypothetical protein